MKRILALCLALAVSCVPAFATGASSQNSNSITFEGDALLEKLYVAPEHSSVTVVGMYVQPSYSVSGVAVPTLNYYAYPPSVPVSRVPLTDPNLGNWVAFVGSGWNSQGTPVRKWDDGTDSTFSHNPYFSTFDYMTSKVPQGDYTYCDFNLDGIVSNTISFSGSCVAVQSIGDVTRQARTLKIFVNGAVVHTVTADRNGIFNLNDFIYTSAVPITDLSFGWYAGSQWTGVTGVKQLLYGFFPYSAKVSFLTSSGAMTGHNQSGQNAINQQNAIESQYTGDMQAKFDQLNIQDFTFGNGLVSALGFTNNLFNSFWSGIGEYKIVYIFPLMLGVVMLVLGRVSKSGGKSKTGKGGD